MFWLNTGRYPVGHLLPKPGIIYLRGKWFNGDKNDNKNDNKNKNKN